VPRAGYPEWKQRPLRSLAAYTDLYTSVAGGADSDAFERWLNECIETPAADALERVRENRRLLPEHWRRLAIYLAALDLRTPASYLEQRELWHRTVPEILEKVLRELPDRYGSGVSVTPEREDHPADVRRIPFPLRVSTEKDPDSGKLVVRAEVTTGREMWLSEMQRMLTSIAEVLTQHRWTLLFPAPGQEWITTDHPVLRLNYYDDGRYDFGGGWGNLRSEILLALSPQHLMYTQIGRRYSGPRTLDERRTREVNRFIAERAHRWVISATGPISMTDLRTRTVDRAGFIEEQKAWQLWHPMQTAAHSP
jgi:hypothetical protein